MKAGRVVSLLLAVLPAFTGCFVNGKSGEPALSEKNAIYMIGASIAYPENTWFEMGCEELGVSPINRAISNTRPSESAMKMAAGEEYSTAELDSFDIFVIMHVHNMNVCDESKLLDDYSGYNLRADMDYSQAFDYIIRRYADDCRALETNPESAWYGIEGGKPVKIMLCTYWHDARVTYNESVRRLAAKWSEEFSVALCRFDENIGFSKDNPNPVTGEQISLQYAQNDCNDIEMIGGVAYGWHPTRGRDAEIQQRMAHIFADAVRTGFAE